MTAIPAPTGVLRPEIYPKVYVDTAKFLSDGCPPIAVSAVDIRLNCVNRGIVLFQEQSTYNDPPDSAVTTQKPPEQIQNI